MKTYKSLQLWLSLSASLDGLYAHLLRHYLLYILMVLSIWAFALHYELFVNLSESLPGTLYVVEKNQIPNKGDYAAFYYSSDFLYPKGARFLKRVVGVAGDVVSTRNHHFFVNGQEVGYALGTTSSGKPILASSFAGVIPPGYFYVRGDHPLSLDSRYQAVGLVSKQIIFGCGFKLF